jgi:hypothetical protein
MEKMRRLKLEAKKSCEHRGHKMGKFSSHLSCFKAESFCINENCKAWVQVNTNPLPNEIEIGGNAVGVNCPINRRLLIPTH